MCEEVGETQENPLQVHGHGWFRAKETPTWMPHPAEVGNAWLARPLASVVGSGPEIQSTTLPIWGAPVQLLAQPVMSTLTVTPMGPAPMQKEVPALAPLTFNLEKAVHRFKNIWSGLLQGCVLYPLPYS